MSMPNLPGPPSDEDDVTGDPPMIVPLPPLNPVLEARIAGAAAAQQAAPPVVVTEPDPVQPATPAAALPLVLEPEGPVDGLAAPLQEQPPPVVRRPPVQRSRPAAPPGLTAAGVVVVVFAGSLVGMLLDVFTGGGIGWLFGAFFIVSSAYAALQVRRSDRAAAVIAPPLVFAVLVMAEEFISSAGDVLAKSAAALNSLLDYGPMLWIGSGLTVAIVGFTMWRERRPRVPSGPAEAPAAARTTDAPPPS